MYYAYIQTVWREKKKREYEKCKKKKIEINVTIYNAIHYVLCVYELFKLNGLALPIFSSAKLYALVNFISI